MNFVLIILFFIFLSPPSADARDPLIPKLEKGKPPLLSEPPMDQHVYDHGLKLYFLQNSELPVFQMSALIEAGGLDDPEEKLGLSGMAISAMRSAGSRNYSSTVVDQKLEQVAAEINVSVSSEYSLLSLKCMTKDLDPVLDIFFDLLRRPAFEPKRVEIIREHSKKEILNRNERPMSVAQREFAQQLYGDKSVWARNFTEKTLEAIHGDDLVLFHKNYIAPNRLWIGASGDISFGELKSKIVRLTENWEPTHFERIAPQPVKKEWEASLQFIPKEANQSAVVIGHFGDKRFNPDKYPIIVANHLLGGTVFGSRLGVRIRSELGLVYSVNSRFELEKEFGKFWMGASTKSESTVQVIQEMKGIFGRLVEKGDVTADELDKAKKVILNQLIFQYEDSAEVVSTRVLYDYYGYPPNYISIFQDEIGKVTLSGVKKVLKKYFYPDRLKIMVVGNPSVRESLGSLGTAEELPLDTD